MVSGLKRLIGGIGVLASLSASAYGQAKPTAVQQSTLSVFAGATGTYIGLGTGRNASITAGVDYGLTPHFGLRPVIEARGTYPILDGGVAAYKNFMGGLKVEKLIFHRFHPYADFLVGEGQLNYTGIGYYRDGLIYQVTSSIVYSPGAGLDLDVTEHFALKADFQSQKQKTPASANGGVWSDATTFGVVYRFDFKKPDTPPNN